jgi:hypothetical protein
MVCVKMVWQRLCIKRMLGKCQRVLIACENLVLREGI